MLIFRGVVEFDLNGQMKWGALYAEVSITWRITHLVHFNDGEVEMGTRVMVVI